MSADASKSRTKLPIRLAAGSGPTFGVDDLACAAATYLGCWEDEGLDVTWSPFPGGVAAVQAVLDGKVDVSYGGLGPVLRFRAQGAPVRIVVSMARALAQQLVVQAKIKKPDDLRGVSWALDGKGALSHHMARLVVAALGIPESEIDWQVVGPPPERIARLLANTIDASLIRVEEAIALTLDPGNSLHTLLGFAELKHLVPVQPHGVLTTLENYEQRNAETLHRLTRGMIRASRALHDDYHAFRKVYDRSVTVKVPDEHVRRIWEQEVASGGFAINGELTQSHWQKQITSFYELNPDLPRVTRDDVIAGQFVTAALEDLGIRDGADSIQ
jgi:ABC-type nitrate/sulfonate/bicarbonate transport system substrate-binding protein